MAPKRTKAGSVTVEVDAKGPTLTIMPPSGEQTGVFEVTFTFDEAVKDFAGSDITFGNAGPRVTGFRGSDGDTVYTADITPKTTGTVTIRVGSGGID